ncbi:MAG: flavodoxin family protein [Planctomycetota bacterium]
MDDGRQTTDDGHWSTVKRKGESVNILGINGSPHLEGNTAYALRHALQVIDAEGTDAEGIETTYLSLADKTIAPCRGCFACREGACVQEDDMRAIVEAIQACDGLLLASPVYMGLVTGQIDPLTQIAQLRCRPTPRQSRCANPHTRVPSHTVQG